jgi:DNA-binding NtrC family response regulator
MPGGGVVLLVDDEPAVLATLAEGLRLGGFDVHAAGSFEAARRAITDAPPDAMITDLRLGAFNGLQLVLYLRDLRPDAPVAVLSGYDDPMLRRDAERQGAVFFTKPVAFDTLTSFLRERLGGAAAS